MKERKSGKVSENVVSHHIINTKSHTTKAITKLFRLDWIFASQLCCWSSVGIPWKWANYMRLADLVTRYCSSAKYLMFFEIMFTQIENTSSNVVVKNLLV